MKGICVPMRERVEALLQFFGLMLPGKVMYIGGSDTLPLPLSREEESELIARLEQGDREARNRLIEHNLRLVAHIMKKYYTQTRDQEDLISIGTIGLIKGISSYKPDKGVRLATYAARCIENAILSQMRLWFHINPPRAEKSQNGVFWHRLRRIYTSFVPLRTAM